MRPDPFGTGTKLVRISITFIGDLRGDLAQCAFVKVIQFGTVPCQNDNETV